MYSHRERFLASRHLQRNAGFEAPRNSIPCTCPRLFAGVTSSRGRPSEPFAPVKRSATRKVKEGSIACFSTHDSHFLRPARTVPSRPVQPSSSRVCSASAIATRRPRPETSSVLFCCVAGREIRPLQTKQCLSRRPLNFMLGAAGLAGPTVFRIKVQVMFCRVW